MGARRKKDYYHFYSPEKQSLMFIAHTHFGQQLLDDLYDREPQGWSREKPILEEIERLLPETVAPKMVYRSKTRISFIKKEEILKEIETVIRPSRE